jgi:heme/copper-type cytochrome/quinol oxidase subunit 3
MAAPTLALPAAGHDKPKHVLNLTALLAGAGSAMVFVALFAGYMNARSLSDEWPLGEVRLDNYIGTTLTVTLFLSVAFAEWGAYAMKRGNRRQGLTGAAFAMLMGVAYLNLLWYLFRVLGFGPADNAFATLSYGLLAAAMVNGLAGFVFLGVAYARGLGRQVPAKNPELLRAAAWYWDYVAVAWLFVFIALYLFQNK